MIVCITGGPGTGKTHLGRTLALDLRAHLFSTDDVLAEVAHLPKHARWSAASQAVAARILTTDRRLVVEGVAVARALRKALDQSLTAPCERLIVLRGRRPEAGEELPGHRAMAAGIETGLAGILPTLRARGVVIEERGERSASVPDLVTAARRTWKVLA